MSRLPRYRPRAGVAKKRLLEDIERELDHATLEATEARSRLRMLERQEALQREKRQRVTRGPARLARARLRRLERLEGGLIREWLAARGIWPREGQNGHNRHVQP